MHGQIPPIRRLCSRLPVPPDRNERLDAKYLKHACTLAVLSLRVKTGTHHASIGNTMFRSPWSYGWLENTSSDFPRLALTPCVRETDFQPGEDPVADVSGWFCRSRACARVVLPPFS